MNINVKSQTHMEDALACLKSLPMLEELETDHLARIATQTKTRSLQRGDVLIREGDDADTLYFVARGKLTVLVKKTAIAEIRIGEPVGEIGFFAGVKRTADVVAARDSELLAISRETYDALALEIPELSASIISSLARRLGAATTGTTQSFGQRSGRFVLLTAAAGQRVPDDLVASLRVTLDDVKGWSTITGDDVPDGASMARDELLAVLEEREKKTKNLLFVCHDPEATPFWAKRCLENSDEVFLVGHSQTALDGPVPLSDYEEDLFSAAHDIKLQLVIWRAEKTERTKHTKYWLRERPVRMHHHLALDTRDDIKRLGYAIQGRSSGMMF